MRGVVRQLVIATFAGVILVGAFSSSAKAGCVDLPKKAAWFPSAYWSGPVLRQVAAYRTSDGRSGDDDAQIVGLWQFQFMSAGNTEDPFHIPDGALLDAGYAQWHSDGTEIMNSSRDPVTSSFCLGAWASVGHRTYKLNHFALSWDNTGIFCTPLPGATNCFVGVANIHEQVTIDREGNTYTGTVTIDQYDTGQQVMFHLTGNVIGHRIGAD